MTRRSAGKNLASPHITTSTVTAPDLAAHGVVYTNSNRSGSVRTRPESPDRRRRSDVRSGAERDGPNDDDKDVIRVDTNLRIVVRDGRLHLAEKEA